MSRYHGFRLAGKYVCSPCPFCLYEVSFLYGGLRILTIRNMSEDGKDLVLRLTEQDGRRGVLQLPFPVTVCNLLEDAERETDTIPYGPFEILTLRIPPQKASEWIQESDCIS